MTDLSSPWLPVLRRILQGQYVADSELAAVFAAGAEVPASVQAYMAMRLGDTLPDHLKATAKRKPGAPPASPAEREQRRAELMALAIDVRTRQLEYELDGAGKRGERKDGLPGPYERAHDDFAVERGYEDGQTLRRVLSAFRAKDKDADEVLDLIDGPLKAFVANRRAEGKSNTG